MTIVKVEEITKGQYKIELCPQPECPGLSPTHQHTVYEWGSSEKAPMTLKQILREIALLEGRTTKPEPQPKRIKEWEGKDLPKADPDLGEVR